MKITDDIVKKYIDSLDRKGLSENYKINFKYYADMLIGYQFSQELMDIFSSKYKHKFHRSFLRSFSSWCNEYLEYNGQPKIKIKILPVKVKKEEDIIIYTTNELEIIFDFYRKNDTEMYLIIKLMYTDGLRVAESIKLKKSNFDMVNRFITGIGKGNKSFKLPIHPTIYDTLEEYLKHFKVNDDMFPLRGVKYKTKKVLSNLKRDLIKLFPYKEDGKSKKKINCHAFRHSCGTNLMREGFNLREVQEFLRHSSLSTT